MVLLGATVLVRSKWQVLAMLVPSAKSGRDCAWLRSRRASARRICSSLRAVAIGGCRDEERPDMSTRARRAASNKEHVCQVGIDCDRNLSMREVTGCNAVLTLHWPST
jgi:hypothetical protein